MFYCEAVKAQKFAMFWKERVNNLTKQIESDRQGQLEMENKVGQLQIDFENLNQEHDEFIKFFDKTSQALEKTLNTEKELMKK